MPDLFPLMLLPLLVAAISYLLVVYCLKLLKNRSKATKALVTITLLLLVQFVIPIVFLMLIGPWGILRGD